MDKILDEGREKCSTRKTEQNNIKECAKESDQVPDGFMNTLKLADPDSFPSIHRLLMIGSFSWIVWSGSVRVTFCIYGTL